MKDELRGFVAQYHSDCGLCGADVYGELAEYREDVVSHVTCPDLEPAAREVCGRCFQERSVSGECGGCNN